MLEDVRVQFKCKKPVYKVTKGASKEWPPNSIMIIKDLFTRLNINLLDYNASCKIVPVESSEARAQVAAQEEEESEAQADLSGASETISDELMCYNVDLYELLCILNNVDYFESKQELYSFAKSLEVDYDEFLHYYNQSDLFEDITEDTLYEMIEQEVKLMEKDGYPLTAASKFL